jgi:hypothetical protein
MATNWICSCTAPVLYALTASADVRYTPFKPAGQLVEKEKLQSFGAAAGQLGFRLTDSKSPGPVEEGPYSGTKVTFTVWLDVDSPCR